MSFEPFLAVSVAPSGAPRSFESSLNFHFDTLFFAAVLFDTLCASLSIVLNFYPSVIQRLDTDILYTKFH
jgi:hypothetical protein